MKKLIIILTVIVATLTSCHKENRYSNKLMDGQFWNVTDVTVNGTSLGIKGVWSVRMVDDIEKEVPTCKWKGENDTTNAIFDWQFLNKGKEFHLTYVQQPNEDGEILSAYDYLVYDITGKYDVICADSDLMEFSSESTIKYNGQTVFITLER